MRNVSIYGMALLITILSLVKVYIQTPQQVPDGVVSAQSCIYSVPESNHRAHLLGFILSNPIRTITESIDLSKHLCPFPQSLCGQQHHEDSMPHMVSVPKHQLAHFHSDNTTDYYVYALHEIIT